MNSTPHNTTPPGPFSLTDPAQSFVVDLSDRTKLLLIGEDRIRYLNGQVTNDVRKTGSDHTLYACVTNLKGRIEGDVFIHRSQNEADQPGLWLDAEPGLRDILAQRLERYIIADDVELHDVTDQWQIFHLFGPAAENDPAQAGSNRVLRSKRFGIPGVDLWIPAGQPAPEFLTEFTHLTPLQVNQLRILHGIPRWPEELHSEVFPQEAGLEHDAMDFHKGCYIGQEILSRIKTSGKMPNQLVRFHFPKSALGNTPLESLANVQLFDSIDDPNPRPCGQITSATTHPELDQIIGLAYVRHNSAPALSLLLVADPTSKIAIPIQVEPLTPQ